jgi:ubiquinone/menaquinone biosynthesis C-methylase UbiE
MISRILLITLLVIAGYLLFMLLIGARILKRFFHFPAPFFVGYFLDSNFRRKMQPPGLLVQRSGLEKGMQVVEVGCGSGAYIPFVARSVGEEGLVHALDIQPKMLQQLEHKLSKAENRDIHNVRVIHGSAYDLPFDDHTLDMAFLTTVLQEIPDKAKALAEIRRVLKPGGILAVTEFLPDPDYRSSKMTMQMVTSAGFLPDGVRGNLWNYTARFRSP